MHKENFKNIIRLVIIVALITTFFSYPQKNLQAAPNFHYIVQLANRTSPKILQTYATNIQQAFSFSQNPQFRNIYTFDSVVPVSTLQKLWSGKINYLETNQTFSAQTIYVNDPGFTSNTQDIDKEWGLVKAGFLDAWTESVGSPSTTVAIIDTGVDATHEDLQDMHLKDGYDFVNNTLISGRKNTDDNGHGTLVAGILAASVNNGIGIAGSNWQISVMPIKALDSSGKGDSATISQAIIWATDHGANIINLSLGGIGFDHDSTLANAISYAYYRNVVLVAAAGNDVAKTGGNLDQNPVFPICDDNNFNMIIGVAATDQNDLKATFSNYGKACIDVDAPGKRILSTINHDPVTGQPSPNSYAFASGTSLAAPFVSGEAALIWAKFPQLTNTQVRDRIIHGADPIDALNTAQCDGNISCAGMLGAGRINVKKSLDIQNDTPQLADGDLVQSSSGGQIYQILGGQRRPVSPFVQNQRFVAANIKTVSDSQLVVFPIGPYATPLEGTLVKDTQDPTVYIISQGLKLPVTYQIFLNRKLSFNSVSTVSFTELNSWVTGNFLPPVEGTLVKAAKNKTVFWTVGQVLHPINYGFFIDRGLNVFPIMVASDNDIANFPKGEAYIR